MKLSFYIYVLCTAVISIFLIGSSEAMHWRHKMGCLPHGGQAPAGYWLDACDAAEVGDLSRDDTWFDLEPSVVPAIKKADVLFFGGSRMLYAASRGGATEWFNSRAWPFYITAYEGDEQSGWGTRLMEKFQPHPKVIIVEAGHFFTGGYSVPAQTIFANEAKERKSAQALHGFFDRMAPLCMRFANLCGSTHAIYRSKIDGHTIVYAAGGAEQNYPMHAPLPGLKGDFGAVGPDRMDLVEKNARTFIASTGVPMRCVIITYIPNEMNDDSLAIALTKRIGAPYVAPDVPNLATFDYTHLTTDASKAWLAAFLHQAEPIIRSCIAG